MGSGTGFGLSPASITPSKVESYGEWGTGSTSGSAPSSANKNGAPGGHLGGQGDPFRGDPAQVRRNMNQMWPKEWDN